jgi:hypothetical protein
MRMLRAAGGSLLLILTGIVGLLGVILSITIILLPLGIPLLWLAKKLFRTSMALFLPRAVRHPAEGLSKKTGLGATGAAEPVDSMAASMKRTRKRAGRLSGKAREQLAQMASWR